MKKIFKLRRTYLIIFSMLLIIGLTFFIVKLCTSEEEFDRVGVSFNSNQYEITSVSSPDDTSVVEMSELYTINSSSVSVKNNYASLIGTKTITISSAEELYAFSIIANSTSAFLSYNYKLLSNIDYSEFAYGFVPVGWNSLNGFNGVFEGNGYTITGLKLMNIANPSEGTSPYAEMQYYAMFSKVGTNGVVSNFGLVNTVIKNTIGTSYTNIQGVAPAVGLNKGEVSYIFVIDTRDAEDAGIYAVGGYQIGGIMYQNEGSFHDSYSIYSRVVHYEVTDYIQFNELLNNNTGSVNNLYFYNSSISVYKSNGDTEDVTYIDAIGKAYSGRTRFGIRVDSIKNLISSVSGSSSKWYTSDNYNGEIDIETPITRGITYNSETKTFTVSNEAEFSYMFEIMNDNSKFATKKYTYLIANNLNLSLLTENNYYYNSTLACTIKGVEVVNKLTTLADGNKSSYPTIFNPGLTKYTLTDGIECYGLFPYLSGEVSNLNVVLTEDKLISGNKASNVHAIGVVAGYVDGGTVKNVNVKYNNITLANNIGKYYFGSVVGVGASAAAVIDATASGTFSDGTQSSSITEATGFDNGVSIGGIIGYSTNTMISIYDVLSCVNFNISSAGAFDTAIGGVLGSGYTINGEDKENDITYKTSNLENRGTININSSSATNLYVAGIIGRHYGMANQVMSFNNAGNITVNGKGSNFTYIAGVENVTINSSSQLKSLGKRQYYASSLTNGAEIIADISDTTNVYFTNVLNIDSNASYKAKIYGVYNLGYNSYSNATLNSQEINMNYIQEFAPVVNYIDGTSDYYLDAESVYNLRDVTYTLNNAISSAKAFNYTGCMLGNYINYNDVRNEGNLEFNLNAQISTLSTLNVSGVFEELNQDFKADKIFNGGNITITENSGNNINLDMYISGICKANNSIIEDTNYNPLNQEFDSTTIGSLNNVINNGDIKVTSTDLNKTTAYNQIQTSTNLNANIYVGGISYTNSGIISNAFNLGDIDLQLFSLAAKKYDVGGITCVNTGQYAQIRDCANNGDLYVIDLSDDYKSIINVGGIVAHNDDNQVNIYQVIAFTINYGTIISFQGQENMVNVAADDSHSNAGGILGVGLCNMVNIVNYGNIYSSECAGGLAAVVDLGDFNNTSASIANTLNYGNIMAMPRYFANGDILNYYINYNEIVSMNYIEFGTTIKRTYIGALISIFDFNSQNNVNVRYLINFDNDSAVVLYNLNVPSANIDVSTFITTRGSVDNFGPAGNYIKYAPLSTIDDDLGNIGAFSENFVFRKAINGIGLDSNYITDSYIGDFFQFIRFDKINDSLLKTIGWETIAYADAAENLARNLEALATLIDESNSDSLLSTAFDSNTWIENSDDTLLVSLIEKSIDSNELDSKLKEVLYYVMFDANGNNAFTTGVRSNVIKTIKTYYEDNSVDYYELLNSLLYPELMAKIISSDSSEYAAVLAKIKEILNTSDNLEDIYNSYISILSNEYTNNISSASSVLYQLFDSNTGDYYEQAKLSLLETLLEGYDEVALEQIYEELNESSSGDVLKYTMYLQQAANQGTAKAIYTALITYNSIKNDASYLSLINSTLRKYDINGVLTSEQLAEINDDSYDGFIANTVAYKNANGTDKLNVQTVTPTLKDSNGNYIIPEKDYSGLWNLIKSDSAIQNYISTNYFSSITDPTSNKVYSSLLAKATEYNNTYQSNDSSQASHGIPDGSYGAGEYVGGINYGGRSGNDYYGDVDFSSTASIKTRFIYTPDDVCSSATNYYGPFNSTGEVFSAGNYLNSNGRNYFKGFYLNSIKEEADDGDDTTGDSVDTWTSREIVPVFISSNEKQLEDKITLSETTTSNKDIYEFYWIESQNTNLSANNTGDFAWKSKVFVTTVNASNTYGYLYKNYNTGDYITDYYDFSPDYKPTKAVDDAISNRLPNGTTASLINKDYTLSNAYNNDFLFTTYCSSAIITGIWYWYSMYSSGSNKGTSLFAKNQTSYGDSGYYGVHTTEYTYYQMKDLLALDGVRTKGLYYSDSKNGPQPDNDEINIISALLTKILSTSEGQQLVLQAIANYSKDKSFVSNDYASVDMLMSSLQNTSFSSNYVINNVKDIIDFNYSNTQTIEDYLKSLNIKFETYNEQIIVYATTDTGNFRKVLLILNDYNSKIDNIDYAKTTITYTLYKYIQYLYEINSDYTDEEIQSLISSISIDDLTYINNLFNNIDVNYAYNAQEAFNDNYDSMSHFAKYLLKDTIVDCNDTTITILEPSYVAVKTNGTSAINIGSYSKTPAASGVYTLIYIDTTGNYNISCSNIISDIYVFASNSSASATLGSSNVITIDDVEAFNGAYSSLGSFDITEYIENSIFEFSLFETFLLTYYPRTTNNSVNRDNDIFNSIITLMATINSTIDDKTYYTIYNDATLLGEKVFTEEILKQLVELIANADYIGESSALALLVDNLDTIVSEDNPSYYDDLILSIDDTQMQINIAEKIVSIVDSQPSTYSKTEKYIMAAYLGNDYLDNLNMLGQSIIYEILNSYSNGQYQFINNSDNTINSTIFTDLLNHLSGEANVDLGGYGIFALSSSKGIGDGIFIPDNFNLKAMDTTYDGNLILTDDILPSWRGGTAGDENNKAEGSVNYAFLVDMKQLKKSISTTIFTLNFTVDSYQIYSAESLIDLDNHIITYYVPSGLFNSSSAKNVTITQLIYANAASSSKSETDTISLKLGENQNAIRITAEDDTVFANYTIVLEEMDISFDITNNNSETIEPTGGRIDVSIISPSLSEGNKNPLPEGFDLRPYLYLMDSNGDIIDQYDAFNAAYQYIDFTYDEGYNIVNAEGSAIIGVEVLSTLPTGDYKLYVSIFNTYGTGSNGKYIEFIKTPSTDATMSDVSFDGRNVEFVQNGNTYTATSLIQFGRAYSYVELLEMNYLDYIPTFANGSTQEISVSKTEPGINEPMSYVVQYIITAENGNQNTYIHNLLEETPFIENGVGTNYVTWYIDGDSQGTRVYDTSNDADNDIKSAFERGEEPIYRIKFEMSNFYTLGDVSYACDYIAKEGVAASTVGAGISVQISDAADTGEYEFTYIYSSEGIWSDGTYVREYTFPSLILSKNPSKDAALSRLTFLDSNVVASGLSTIINPNYALKPVENQAALTNANELYYYDELYNSSGKEILVDGKTINYNNLGNDYATTDTESEYFTNHFFSLGSIANAQLQYYAPVFDIEDHAQMYQYTTLNKLKYYGATKQQKSDTEVLTSIFEDGDITYLYIPFSTEDNKAAVFLVELDITNNTWTNVYTTAFDGTNADTEALGSLNGDKTTGISYQGSTYYVDASAGKPIDNVSLYMDYIGSPEQDHFWYISYIVLSEDYLKDSTPSDNLAYKCYHISLIDITNTVFYEISIKAPKDFALESLYLTIGYNVYDVVNNVEQSTFTTNSISAYASKDSESQFDGYDSYTLNSNLSILPNGYYYFYVDLPDGYAAKLTVDKVNRNDMDYQNGSYYKESEDGAYLPPSSIVTQKVAVQIEIYSTLESDGTIWGEATSNIYTKQIILE